MRYQEYRITGGLNLSRSPDVLEDGELSNAVGCQYDQQGAVESQAGRDTVLSIAATGTILGTGDAVLGGTRRRFTKIGSTIYLDNVSIATDWTGSGHLKVVGYNDYAYLADGTNSGRYSIAGGLQAIGVSAPATAIGVGKSGTGGGFLEGNYKYTFTFFNGRAESNFAPSVTMTISAAEETTGVQADLSGILVGPAGTTERRVYRTDLNQNSFYLIEKIADNTTTTTTDLGGVPPNADPDAAQGDAPRVEKNPNDDIQMDNPAQYPASTAKGQGYEDVQLNNEVWVTNLGLLADWTDHDPAPAGLRNLVLHGDTIFGTEGNNLRWTRTAQPEYWSEFYSVPVGRQTGETLMAIMPLDHSVICYTDGGIYRFTRIGREARESTMEATDSPVGLVARNAVAPVFFSGGQSAGHVFLARDGVYLFDGRSAIRVSQRIDDIFTDPDQAHYGDPLNNAGAVMGTVGDRTYLSYSTTGAANTRTLIADFRDSGSIKFSVSLDAYDTLTLGLDGRLIGGTSGTLFEVGVESANNSQTMQITTKQFPFAGSTIDSTPERIRILADTGGVSTAIKVVTDYGDEAEFTIIGSGQQLFQRLLPATMRGTRAHVEWSSTSGTRRALHAIAFQYEDEPIGPA